MTIEELKRVAGGISVPTQPVPPAPITFVQNPPGCSLQTNPQPTPESVGIDPSTLVGRACGYFEIEVDMDATSISADALWVLGAHAQAGNIDVLREVYELTPTIESVYDVAAATDGVPGGTNFASFDFSEWLNEAIFGNTPVIISKIAHRQGISSDAIFQTTRNTVWQIRSMGIQGNYAQHGIDAAADRCSPCFNSDDNVVEWQVSAPISGAELIAFRLPDGIQGIFRFCVDSIASVRQFIPCAGGR